MAALYPCTCASCGSRWNLAPGWYEIMAGRGGTRLGACEQCKDLQSVTVWFEAWDSRKRLPDPKRTFWDALRGVPPPQPRYSNPVREECPFECRRDASHTLRPWTFEDPCPACGGGPVQASDEPSVMVD